LGGGGFSIVELLNWKRPKGGRMEEKAVLKYGGIKSSYVGGVG